jgi:glycosyltransferase involved in cell wall biosynthesis
MSDPRVSVVVVAYQRADFVRDAVRSVIGQTLEPSQFEVVLLTDVTNLDLGPMGNAGRVVQVALPPGSWGEWVLSALPECHGEVLCFLDDDDLFDRGKLASVLSTFDRHPSVGYYHNRISRFVEASSPSQPYAPDTRGRPVGPDCGLVEASQKTRAVIDRLFWDAGGFNDSAIAVRREVLASHGPLMAELELGHSLALFYAAALGKWDLFFDATPLTRYRIHAGNRSTPAGSGVRLEAGRARDDGAAIVRDADRIARFIDSDPHHRLSWAPVRSVGTRTRLLRALTDPETSRGALLRLLREYLAFTPFRSMVDNRGMLGLSLAGLLAPRLPSRWLGP